MKILIIIFISALFLYSIDYNLSNNYQSENDNLDFDKSFKNLMSGLLEFDNGIDFTYSNINFESKNIEVKNINSLYENSNNSLLFQKQLDVNYDYYNYFGSLINRYEINNFLFGINIFNGRYNEVNMNGFGGEIFYKDIFRFDSRYYKEEDGDKVNFKFEYLLNDYNFVGINLNQTENEREYKITYNPYSIFNITYGFKDLKYDTSNTIMIGFTFEYDDTRQNININKIRKGRYNFIDSY